MGMVSHRPSVWVWPRAAIRGEMERTAQRRTWRTFHITQQINLEMYTEDAPLCAVCRHSLRPEPLALTIFRQAVPSQLFQYCRYPSLIGCPDLRLIEEKRTLCDIADCYFCARGEKLCDHVFPGVRLETRLLLLLDTLFLERSIRPPCFTQAVEVHGLGKQLIPILGQTIDVDSPGLNRPETPTTTFVTQIGFPIGGTYEYALAGFLDLEAAVAGPILFDPSRNKAFEQRRLGSVHRVHLADFDEPLTTQMLTDVLAAADVWQRV
jgi:hypothetical protein